MSPCQRGVAPACLPVQISVARENKPMLLFSFPKAESATREVACSGEITHVEAQSREAYAIFHHVELKT